MHVIDDELTRLELMQLAAAAAAASALPFRADANSCLTLAVMHEGIASPPSKVSVITRSRSKSCWAS